jgi:hypothetical protein
MVLGGTVPVLAQEEQPAAEEVIPEEQLDVTQIDQILRGDEEVMRGDMFAYDPAGRRDPFRSLLEGLEGEDEEGVEVRPPGLAGMLVEELRVEGIIQTPSGILAFVQGHDNLSYIIRPGTKLYNGEVKEIFNDRVVFRQQVNDPKQVRPYNEVVREVKN